MKKLLLSAATTALVSAGVAATATAAPAAYPAPQAPGLAVATPYALPVAPVHDVGRRHARHYLLPPRVVRHKLRRKGYHHIRRAGFVRGDYIFIARKNHKRFKLRIDGRTGQIVHRHRIRRHWNGPGYHQHRNGGFTFYYGWN